eukprot:555176_1
MATNVMQNVLLTVLLMISIVVMLIRSFGWRLLSESSGNIINYKLVSKPHKITQSQKKLFKFYLLDLPFTNIYSHYCNNSELIYKYFYQHPARSFNILQANIIIPKWTYIKSFANTENECLKPTSSKTTQHTIAIMEYFYKLKHNHSISNNAWLFILLWPTDVLNERMQHLIDNNDISLFQSEANMHPMFHFKRDIDIPAITIKHIYDNKNTQIKHSSPVTDNNITVLNSKFEVALSIKKMYNSTLFF